MYEVDVSHGSELPAGRRLNEKIRRLICNYQRSAILVVNQYYMENPGEIIMM